MPASYAIEHDILILRVALDRFAELAETVRAASQDPAFGARGVC